VAPVFIDHPVDKIVAIVVDINFCCRYGYLTWEWQNGLRGYMYPTMFAVIYKLLGFLHMDSRTLVVSLPCVMFFNCNYYFLSFVC